MRYVSFDLYSHGSEPAAHMAFRSAMKLLDHYSIPYSQTIEDVYFNEPPNKHRRTYYTVHKIFFYNEEDYLAYILIKD
jgi:hypothetical protein